MRLQADVLLEPDDLGDRLVFHRAQLRGVDRLLDEELFARLEQVLRAQEAADVVGAERGRGAGGHRRLRGWQWRGMIGRDRCPRSPESISALTDSGLR